MAKTKSVAENFLDGVGKRVGSIWAIILPIFLNALIEFLENCELEGKALAEACCDPNEEQEHGLRRAIFREFYESRRYYRWRPLQAIRFARRASKAAIDEAREVGKRVSGGDDTEALTIIQELLSVED